MAVAVGNVRMVTSVGKISASSENIFLSLKMKEFSRLFEVPILVTRGKFVDVCPSIAERDDLVSIITVGRCCPVFV